MLPVATKSQKLFLASRSKSRSLTLVSFERASLAEYACQYEVSISYGSKVIAKENVDSRQTNRQDKNQWVFVKHYSMPPAATKSKKLFLAARSKSRSQGH